MYYLPTNVIIVNLLTGCMAVSALSMMMSVKKCIRVASKHSLTKTVKSNYTKIIKENVTTSVRCKILILSGGS
jgi:hypothetical protein